MKPRVVFFLGLALMPFLAQGADASRQSPRQARELDRMVWLLGLSDTQKSQIQAIQARHADKARNDAPADLATHRALKEAMDSRDATPQQLKTLFQAQTDKDFDLMMDRRIARDEVRAVLTPDQRSRLDAWKADRKPKKPGKEAKHVEPGTGF